MIYTQAYSATRGQGVGHPYCQFKISGPLNYGMLLANSLDLRIRLQECDKMLYQFGNIAANGIEQTFIVDLAILVRKEVPQPRKTHRRAKFERLGL